MHAKPEKLLHALPVLYITGVRVRTSLWPAPYLFAVTRGLLALDTGTAITHLVFHHAMACMQVLTASSAGCAM